MLEQEPNVEISQGLTDRMAECHATAFAGAKPELRIGEGRPFAIVPYAPRHLRALALQPMQAELGAFLAAGDYAEKVALAGPAWTALDFDRPIACAGFTFPWEGRAIAWAVLGDCGARMLRVTRAVRCALDRCPVERIECQVKADFVPGLRWAAALGFIREAFLPRFCRGEDFWSYVILKSGH